MKQDVWAAGDLDEPYVGRWSRVVAKDCGTGALTQTILRDCAPGSVHGVDPSAGFIESARRRTKGASFEVGDAQALPAKDGEFDAAVAGLVLNFVPRPERAVGEMRRAVRPGGTRSSSTPRRAALRDRIRSKLPIHPDGSIHLVGRAWAVKGAVG